MNREVVGDRPVDRRPGLADGRDQIEQQARIASPDRIRLGRGIIDQARGIETERDAAFRQRLLRQQHAPHIGVLDDRHLRLGRVLGAKRAALAALLGVAKRIAIARMAQHGRAEADPDARLVHHLEHDGETLVALTDELRHAIIVLAEGEDRRGRAAIAHLVKEAHKGDVVGRATSAIGRQPEPRHDEEREAFHSRGRAFGAREHEVDDVVRQLVLAARDPLLGALEAPGAIRHRPCAGSDVAKRRAGAGLGQAHRAEPAPLQHRRKEGFALDGRAEARDQIARSDGEERIGRGRDVGRLEERERGLHDDPGQLRAADRRIVMRSQKPCIGKGLERRLHFRDSDDPAILEPGLGQIGRPVVVGKMAGRQALGGFEHLIVDRAFLASEACARRQPIGREHVIEQKAKDARVRELGHDEPAALRPSRRSRSAWRGPAPPPCTWK